MTWTQLAGRRDARWRGAALGIIVDLVLGEPPVGPHPVSAFGRVMDGFEERFYRDGRTAGLAHAATGVAIGVTAGRLLRSTTAATYLAVAGRALGDAAAAVASPLAGGDLEGARSMLPALVGRDPSELDDKEICRAVVESVAENTVDAIIAPALWGAVAGAPGALAYRTINTLDARVGHHSDRYERFGWASARLDDVVNMVPARVTALLVFVVRPHRVAAIFSAVRYQAGDHPSPNAGVAEAAFAAALGVRLGGENRYGDRVEVRPALGSGPPPGPADIPRAVKLSRDVSLAAALLLVGSGWVLNRLADRRRRRRR